MNNIDYIVRRIEREVPQEIIDLALGDKTNYGQKSMARVIHEIIIEQILLQDCNLFGGKVMKIQLLEQWKEYVEQPINSLMDQYTVYRVPPEARDNLDINYVVDINVDTDFAPDSNFPVSGPNTFTQMASNALHSYTGQGAVLSPRVVLKGNNILQLSHANSYGRRWLVTCLIGYDKGFSDITPSMLDILADMAVYALEAYAYNKLRIRIGKGQLMLGKELAPIKDTIDGYNESNRKYKEALTRFRGAHHFDKEALFLTLDNINP